MLVLYAPQFHSSDCEEILISYYVHALEDLCVPKSQENGKKVCEVAIKSIIV